VAALQLSDAKGVKILYSPLHGTGLTSVYPVLKGMGFDIHLDPATANLSGAFENVTFNIPNPEVIQSFDTALPNADAIGADVIMSTDPDADRIGIMVRHNGEWKFLNGNEIGIVLTEYAIAQYRKKGRLTSNNVIIKTEVTSSLIDTIAAENGIQCIGDLLVGFKYIGERMNRLEAEGRQADFILGTEESHGFLMGNYARDKDAAGAALWLAELTSRLKADGRTLVDYLDGIYAKYGYCHNYLTEIRLLGARGIGRIKKIMDHLRGNEISSVGDFKVAEKIDRWKGDPQPHLSRTDTSSRNVLILKLERTCPKPAASASRSGRRAPSPNSRSTSKCLAGPSNFPPLKPQRRRSLVFSSGWNVPSWPIATDILGVDFPERGFLLFWQLPLDDKMKYFEIEEQIAGLKAVADSDCRKEQLDGLLKFLGANPVLKVDRAFAARYGSGINAFLSLD
jgi:phosphoglucomutase